jgi:hypothetical protein
MTMRLEQGLHDVPKQNERHNETDFRGQPKALHASNVSRS